MIWRFRGRALNFERVRLMGVLNVTPDSFSDGGRYFTAKKAVSRALELEALGADLIDIGGESTRPGARAISCREEEERVLPVIREIRSQTALPLSIDTTKPEVARKALAAGADIINDVDGLGAASSMAGLAREFGAGLILMHRRGDAGTMHEYARYTDVVHEVFQELDKSYAEVLAAGVDPEQVALDPGIGFAKNTEQNLELLNGLRRFQAWGRPILVGPSRKSFIGALIDRPPAERDWGTAGAVALAIAGGANIVRIHQVAGLADVVRVAEAIVNQGAQADVRS